MTTPKVFISYSHDCEEHKAWVADLARFLVSNGIDVIIDAWNLRRGEDIPKFMEDGLSLADRVLMICTERYVEKADGALGGVGYEKMIVTAELIRDLGTAKFVPVIRQTTPERKIPRFMGRRYYVDLSADADADVERQHLLKELHNVPPDRPPLGQSPFTVSPATPANSTPSSGTGSSDPADVYERALAAGRAGDILGWRALLNASRSQMSAGFSEWLLTYRTVAPSTGDLEQQTMEGVGSAAPLIAVALGGIASTLPRLKDQATVLEDILHPAGWDRSGYVRRTELPMSAAFVFQALHGALCLYIDDLATAFKLARLRTQSPLAREAVPLWARHDIVMWPQALGQDATAAWRLISDLATRWPWVSTVFGNAMDYQSSLLGYYIALNTLEFLEFLAAGRLVPDDPAQLHCDIVPVFESMPDEIKRRAYRALVAAGQDLKTIAAQLKLDVDLIRRQWPKWVNVQIHSLHLLYPFARAELAQEQLIPDIFWS